MNNLSWLIIAADVIPSLSIALAFASFLAFAIFSILYFLGVTGFFGDESDDSKHTNYARAIAPRFRRLVWAPPLFAFLWFLSFAVPDDKETYYAVAASELGEEVVSSPTASKALKALDAWLDKQIPKNKPA